jgi:hypothetical protein
VPAIHMESRLNLTWFGHKGFMIMLPYSSWFLKKKLNSVALVRERTIPTERPALVGEVSANFCG